MTDAEPFFLNDIPENSNGSTGSQKETDPIAHSLGPPSETSTDKNQEKKPSLPALRTRGGNLSDIAKSVTEDISSNLPQSTKEATLKFINANAHGFVGGLAMQCRGERCPILSDCPLYQTNQTLPVGSKCPFEASLVQTWVNRHLMALGIDDYADPANSFDMDMLYELAANELIKWKASQHLSRAGSIITERQVAANTQGDAIFAEVISPALEVIDVHTKITMKLRDALLATRKAQIQAGKDMGDPSKKAAELAEKARKKAMDRLGKGEQIKDAEYDVK